MSSTTDPGAPIPTPTPQPPLFNYILGFILVGMAWGLTTPFMRRAAISYTAPSRPILTSPSTSAPKRLILTAFFAVFDLLRRPAYAVPFLLNVTGSIWFFLLIGQAELSLTVPITNSLAFLFTVLGEWWAEGKRVERDTWVGMGCVLLGIGLCVRAKS